MTRPRRLRCAQSRSACTRAMGGGIGSALLAALERRAQELGYTELLAETRRVHTDAVSFYLRRGYRTVQNYGKYASRPEAVCFAKTLGERREIKNPPDTEDGMDIWERLYEKARAEYHPMEVSPFVYAHHVVCALESENGQLFSGFCIESASGVMNLCAERMAVLDMYHHSGQTVVRRMIAFRDRAPDGGGSGMPCGACREFLMQLSPRNREMEILVNYETRETVTLGELMPLWWGEERMRQEGR